MTLEQIVRWTPKFPTQAAAEAYAQRNAGRIVVPGPGVWYAATPEVAAELAAAGFGAGGANHAA